MFVSLDITKIRRRSNALLATAVVGLGLAGGLHGTSQASATDTSPGNATTASQPSGGAFTTNTPSDLRVPVAKPDLTISTHAAGYVVVKNQGSARASQFHVYVVDDQSTIRGISWISGLDPGASMKITNAYINPNICGSSVKVDRDNMVAESNESNNNVWGYCVK